MKRIAAPTALAASLLFAPAAIAKGEPNHVYGPAPDWDRFRTLAELAVTAKLLDPESARIRWLGGYRQGGFKPFMQGKVYGYSACGTVNARNRMGGYAGATTFAVVIDFDRVLYVELDSRPGGFIETGCADALRKGMLPPVPDGGIATAPAAPAKTVSGVGPVSSPEANALGLSLQAMPEGVYVRSVAAGSPAAAAGVTPGMVITAVNGIVLAGMGEAAGKVVAAAGGTATLTMVGGQSLRLGAAR